MDYRVLKGRAADHRGGTILRLTERALRSESSVLTLLYVGFWGVALLYVLVLVW